MQGIEQIHAAFDHAEAVAAADAAQFDPGGENAGPPPSDGECIEAHAATYPLNDYGNGQRLIAYFGENMLFVPRLGWARWDGRRWAADEDELQVRRDAQQIAGRILGEIPHIALEDWQREALELWHQTRADFLRLEKMSAKDRSPEDTARFSELRGVRETGVMIEEHLRAARAAHRAHARAAGNSGKLSNMLGEARPLAARSISELNADPLMLNCGNGVVHFRKTKDAHAEAWGQEEWSWTADLLPHHRSHYITKLARADYDPQAACPNFEAFLATVQPDPEIRAFLQRWFGYSLTGLTSEQKLAFLYGGGRNGKSTLIDVLADILADYGTSLPIETLTGTEQRKGSDATPDLVRLPGARFVRASEPEQGTRMKEALIKQLTGGEPIMIRRMMQEFVEITPEFKLTISGNHKPEIRGADDGIWRRVLLVPFDVQIAAADVDQDLPAKLRAEAPGILAWMVRGCLDYLDGGLNEPDAVLQATEEYRQESDPLRVFLTTECEITGAGDDFVRARDVIDAFNAWLLDQGEAAWGKRTVANQLKKRAGSIKGDSGNVFAPGKRSDTGYFGLAIPAAAMDRIAKYGDELRSAAARRG